MYHLDRSSTQSCFGKTFPFMTGKTPSRYIVTDAFVDENSMQC